MKKFGMMIMFSLVLFSKQSLVIAKNYASQAVENTRTQKESESFIQDLGDAAIGIINKPGITEKDVQVKFRDLLNNNFAIKSIARYSLGKNFRILF